MLSNTERKRKQRENSLFREKEQEKNTLDKRRRRKSPVYKINENRMRRIRERINVVNTILNRDEGGYGYLLDMGFTTEQINDENLRPFNGRLVGDIRKFIQAQTFLTDDAIVVLLFTQYLQNRTGIL